MLVTVIAIPLARNQRTRQVLSMGEKLKIIKASESGKSRSQIHREFGLSNTTIYDILKCKEFIKAQCSAGLGSNIRRSRGVSRFPSIDKCLIKWIKQTQVKNIPLSGTLLQEKSKEIAIELGIKDFSASNGWLGRFKQRHNIVFSKRRTRESTDESVDKDESSDEGNKSNESD